MPRMRTLPLLGPLVVVLVVVGALATPAIAQPGSHSVDLVGNGRSDLTSAPGEIVQLPLTVRNAGPDEAQGVALSMNEDFELDPHVRYRNCSYFDDPHENALCRFDVVLEPDVTYELGTPIELAVRADAEAPASFVLVGSWLTRAGADEQLARLSADGYDGVPGTGPELTLVEVGGAAPAPAPADPVPATDSDPENNLVIAFISTEGDNPADFAAVGDRLVGEVGDEVTARVGVTNLGPAMVDAGRSGLPVNRVRFTFPEGTSAVQVPERCTPEADTVYRCSTGTRLLVGESATFDFVLRIDRVIPDATGLVEVNRPPAADAEPADDGNPTNDIAEVVLNPTSDGGGDGGGLPVTGVSTGALAGAGALLVALGGLGLWLVRRRRTRFVA